MEPHQTTAAVTRFSFGGGTRISMLLSLLLNRCNTTGQLLVLLLASFTLCGSCQAYDHTSPRYNSFVQRDGSVSVLPFQSSASMEPNLCLFQSRSSTSRSAAPSIASTMKIRTTPATPASAEAEVSALAVAAAAEAATRTSFSLAPFERTLVTDWRTDCTASRYSPVKLQVPCAQLYVGNSQSGTGSMSLTRCFEQLTIVLMTYKRNEALRVVSSFHHEHHNHYHQTWLQEQQEQQPPLLRLLASVEVGMLWCFSLK